MHPLPSLPGYQLLREIGGGALTRVFHARHQTGGFDCAIKMLRPEWHHDAVAQQLIRREARVGLAVRHRHLIKLFDADVRHEPNFLVMDLMTGESLRPKLQRQDRLDPRSALRIGLQIAAGIQALHQVGFAHCDIKPENIYLDDDGSAVLMDLGFAHKPGEHTALIRSGYLFGTPDYLAPELCGFQTDHTFASDWFSFGLVLLEMLTGELPYKKGDAETVLQSHEDMDIRFWVRHRTRMWPTALGQLVASLVAYEADERPAGRMIVNQLYAVDVPERLILKVA